MNPDAPPLPPIGLRVYTIPALTSRFHGPNLLPTIPISKYIDRPYCTPFDIDVLAHEGVDGDTVAADLAAGASGLAYTPAISSFVDSDPAVFGACREVRWGAEGGAVVWRGGAVGGGQYAGA